MYIPINTECQKFRAGVHFLAIETGKYSAFRKQATSPPRRMATASQPWTIGGLEDLALTPQIPKTSPGRFPRPPQILIIEL